MSAAEPTPDPWSEQEGERDDGRCPPYDLHAEESLLGAMLLTPRAIEAAADVGILAEDFFKPAHALVFDAILVLHAAGEPADPVTITDRLRRTGHLTEVGDTGVLLSWQIRTPATSSARRYARIVIELAVLRQLIAAAGEITEIAYSVPADVPAAVLRVHELLADVAGRCVAICEGEDVGVLAEVARFRPRRRLAVRPL